jgi:uncharacterized protein (TIGR03435 family)
MDISLLKMIGEAYGVYDDKLITGGPPWIDRDKFDLEAKIDAAELDEARHLTFRDRADMLQALLAERFRLKVHREKKQFPVYDLVVTKSGSKLQEARPEDTSQGISGAACLFRRSRLGYVQVQGCLPEDLETPLRFATGRTVIDKTGITTRSNFELRWTPFGTPADSPEALAPSIFTAVQEQLGLRLVPSTARLSILVIDSAERPTEN